MKTIPQGHETRLDRGLTLRLTNASGIYVRCRSGCLWLTQENDSRDIILHAGEAFGIDRDGLTLVHACADSTLTTAAGRGHAAVDSAGAGVPAPAAAH